MSTGDEVIGSIALDVSSTRSAGVELIVEPAHLSKKTVRNDLILTSVMLKAGSGVSQTAHCERTAALTKVTPE